MTLPTNPHGFYPDIPEPEYHAHPTSLSVSGAKTLIKCPALFHWQRTNPVHKATYDEGTAAHAIVLGAGIENIYVVPFDDWRTKAAQEERKLAYAEGMAPILPETWENACRMADAIDAHPGAAQLLTGGEPEVSAFAVDPETGVLRRARFDYLRPDVLVDYKTAVDSDPWSFETPAAKYGYAMQAAWYLDIAADLEHPAEAFGFVVQMKEPPYLVSVVELDDQALGWGRSRNRRALQMFRDCTETGLWPGWQPDGQPTTVSVPAWAIREEWTA